MASRSARSKTGFLNWAVYFLLTVGGVDSFSFSFLTSGLEITLLAECPLDRGKIAGLPLLIQKLVDNRPSLSNVFHQYAMSLGFDGV